MKYHIAGKENEKTVLLLPGTCCTSKLNFSKVVPMLAAKYKVICVDYDGFDGKPGEFTTMTGITRKIEQYITERCGGEIFAAYGSSLGGSFVGLLIQRGNVHIRHGIIGSSDLDQSGKVSAKIKTALVSPLFGSMLKKGRMPKWAVNMTKNKMGEEAAEKYLEFMDGFIESAGNASMKSIKNQFYSDLVTPLDKHIEGKGTTVHIFYALKMGEKYRERYLEHFADPDIREQNYGHEELLFFEPEKWFEEFEACVNDNSK
jgi:hypothetical protein